ncbi:hypothetical protein Pelo_16166 [Pelomyxa schiedti]|nr:hypothetical protein Pelo_16166 [Pelomyxa schiedti]
MAKTSWTKAEVLEMIKDPKRSTSILVTHDGDNLGLRPMMTRIRDNGEMYFVTHKMSAKANQVRANPNASLEFGGYQMSTDPNEAWIIMNAKITISEDPANKQAAWLPFLAHIYAGGPTDPMMVLLEVHPTEVFVAQPGRKTAVSWS